MFKYLLSFLVVIIIISCQSEEQQLEKAESVISTEAMISYVKELGSDEYMGRKPFGEAENLTIAYLEKCFQDIGLEPANGNSYFQKVPLIKVTRDVNSSLDISVDGKGVLSFSNSNDFVAFSQRIEKDLELKESDLVFAGYGIVAAEYNWNDYEGLDVKGKTVVVLVNDPGLDSGRDNFFTGDAMTYYGRWKYKYEEAARQGAEGILIVHDDKGAGYNWSVVDNSAAVAKVYPVVENNYLDRCKIEGWIQASVANQLFEAVDMDMADVITQAKTEGFKGFELKAKVDLSITNSWKKDDSHNVLGVIPGTDLADEYLFYSAHWDHLGIGNVMNGDSIYNGAVDNGTSLAWMMEIAKAFKAMPVSSRRSIVFFAPTAEESGLNGSGYYADNPIFPINKTVANINNDLMLPFGRCKDVMITGYGKSDLDDIISEEAEKKGRYVLPDPNAHTGMYYRSDHFSFARVGIPAAFARGNNDHWEKGKEYMAEREQFWIDNCYHKPDDEYEDWWDLSGVEEDAKLLFRVGWRIANSDVYPQWKEGAEFKAIRDKQFE
ncbi:M28 family peptidase [Carboxylicivirga sp. N1Y90]|uniref:M28 family peptidase n=1 Tax=Carboxylicivirga fragile TaxID=3417571 RepID=UPI003D34439C|nr:M28 family peptidase [Marinilabiliaceae bacterium N1Y90]